MAPKPRGILDRLMAATGANTQVALAEHLEVPPSSITDALRRGKIPEAWVFKVAYLTRRRAEWLRTGEEPEFQEEASAEGTAFGRSATLKRLVEALETMDEEEQRALERCAEALCVGDHEIRQHLIGQLKIIEDAVKLRHAKRGRGPSPHPRRAKAG